MDAIQVIREELTQAHEMLEFAIGGLSAEQLHHKFPGSSIQAAGPIYVHTVTGEDFLVTAKMRGLPPIYQTGGWGAKIGIDPGEGFLTDEWAAAVRITDLSLLQSYAQAVYSATDEYLATLTPEDLDGTIDFMGEMSIGGYLGKIIVWHPVQHGGEIAAIKGMFGLQGLPF